MQRCVAEERDASISLPLHILQTSRDTFRCMACYVSGALNHFKSLSSLPSQQLFSNDISLSFAYPALYAPNF